MQRVLGIGGLFFRAKDPAALAAWYRDRLGIGPAPGTMEEMPWKQEAGFTVFEPFSITNDYFGLDRAFMLNFRVADLDAMVRQLKDGGITVSAITDYPMAASRGCTTRRTIRSSCGSQKPPRKADCSAGEF